MTKKDTFIRLFTDPTSKMFWVRLGFMGTAFISTYVLKIYFLRYYIVYEEWVWWILNFSPITPIIVTCIAGKIVDAFESGLDLWIHGKSRVSLIMLGVLGWGMVLGICYIGIIHFLL